MILLMKLGDSPKLMRSSLKQANYGVSQNFVLWWDKEFGFCSFAAGRLAQGAGSSGEGGEGEQEGGGNAGLLVLYLNCDILV